jgi:hypothetical protein
MKFEDSNLKNRKLILEYSNFKKIPSKKNFFEKRNISISLQII